MIKFIKTTDPEAGVQALSNDIGANLEAGRKVLWLVSGGSNIPISVRVMNAVRGMVSSNTIPNLTVTLTDERFGPVGHADSNWKQLEDAGFDISGVQTIPVLSDTVSNFTKNVMAAIDASDFAIGQFGIGADDHIAGILPNSPAATSREFVCAYEAPPHMRITLTFGALKRLHAAYAFVFGEAKKDAMLRLRRGGEPRESLPSIVLGEMAYAVVYSDQ